MIIIFGLIHMQKLYCFNYIGIMQAVQPCPQCGWGYTSTKLPVLHGNVNKLYQHKGPLYQYNYVTLGDVLA